MEWGSPTANCCDAFRCSAKRAIQSEPLRFIFVSIPDRDGRPLFPELVRKLDALSNDRIAGPPVPSRRNYEALIQCEKRSFLLNPRGQEGHQGRWTSRRTYVHVVSAWRHHRSCGRRAQRRGDPRDQPTHKLQGPPPVSKKTLEQVAEATSKRRVARTKRGHL